MKLEDFRAICFCYGIVLDGEVMDRFYREVLKLAKKSSGTGQKAQEIIAYFCEQRSKKGLGHPIFEPKDLGRLKALLDGKHRPVSVEKLKELIDVYFSQDEGGWFSQNGWPFSTFMNKLSRWQALHDARSRTKPLPTTNKPHLEIHKEDDLPEKSPPPPEVAAKIAQILSRPIGNTMPMSESESIEERKERLLRQAKKLEGKG